MINIYKQIIILQNDPSICVILLDDNNKNSGQSLLFFDKSIFLFLESCCWVFFRKWNWISLFFITESSSLDAYGKTSSWILSICSTVYLFRRGCTWQQNQTVAIIFWWDMFFNNSFNITFTWCFDRVYIWNNFFFSFSLDNFAYQLNFSVFWALNPLSPSIFISTFLFSVLFWMLRVLVTVNKLKRMAYHWSTRRE